MAIKYFKSKMVAQGSMSVTATMRTLLASTYLQGGKRFSELARSMKRETSDPLYVAYVTGAIFLSIAALEAAVNAVWIDSFGNHEIDTLNLLEKCERLLEHRSKKLAEGTPVQKIRALVCLRNELVHYKPEWDDKLEAHKRVEKKIQAVIPRKLLPYSFPKDYLMHEFAIEAPTWCCAFAEYFFCEMEMDMRLECCTSLSV
ncbi:hypothetical protein KAX17_07110 [Candidatus Bipolaricaulota bacterium]|nr:hypothetical protein [Candidatus Bipolaricaulota bacterium]